jgi:hypothetical protein
MLLLTTLLALTIADLQPLPEDQRVQLSAKGFADSVRACVEALDASELYCGCVVRGFQMFLPHSDWNRLHGDATPHNMAVIAQVQRACRIAAPTD